MGQKRLFRSNRLAPATAGTFIDITPKKAGWELIRFGVRQLPAGTTWKGTSRDSEVCVVLLNGTVRATFGRQDAVLGPRAGVFGGYPFALYLPAGSDFRITAEEPCELAECRVPSTAALAPRLIRPEDCGFEIRGGGNATRQIVDIIRPDFPADRLLICEVYTPSGNWSSYPPHKHDVDNPPQEVDLEEIYYFRFRDPAAYGFQRLYGPNHDETLKVEDGDVVVVRDGYHPFVSAYGYDAYYLNVLAGSRRSMAASDDPRYAGFRSSWPPADPRVPLVEPPPELRARRA
jgi:5-deoxy-glucuronate isomerase